MSRILALPALALLLSCASPGPATRDSTADPSSLQEAAPGLFVARLGALRAELSADGLLASRGNGELRLRFAAWGREGLEQPVSQVEPLWGGCIAGSPRLPAEGCLQRVELLHPGLTEYWQPAAGGLEQGWKVEQSPAGSGLLAFQVQITGAIHHELEADALGARLLDSSGRSWRYAGLRAWDARGESLPAWMQRSSSGLVILVDDLGAVYPLTVDPTLSESSKLLASDGASYEYYGWSVSGAGDVNADGFGDVIVGAREDDEMGSESGAAYLYLGSPSGIDASTETKLLASDGESGDSLGSSVSSAGDVNGDGYDDLLVGAYRDDDFGSMSGSTYVYLGSSGGVDASSETKLLPTDGAAGDYFGVSVSGAGDVNGDGYDDIVVGAHQDDDNRDDSGSAYLFLGSGGGVDASSETKLLPSDGAEDDYFGRSVSGAGDVNADGFADLIVGAYRDEDAGTSSGSAYLYLGSISGIDPRTETKLTASDAAESDRFGISVSAAGDVNDDGYDDIVVGAYGDHEEDDDSGSAYLYLGSPSGIDLSSEAKLTASDGDSENYFGYSVSGAGDVNGDGYEDVMVGAYKDDHNGTDSGSAYLYLGSSTGIDPSSETKLLASDGSYYDKFGVSVSGAGDVDGDGYDDVIVGAVEDDDMGSDAGAAYLFHGFCTNVWYADSDGDGFGDPTDTSCSVASGYVVDDTDCDDGDGAINPAASEICDAVDNDCDGLVDDDDDSLDSSTWSAWYADQDSDGYGDPSDTIAACDPPTGYVDNGDDCDDADATVSPAAEELCNELDDDCDDTVDEGDATDAATWYGDGDGDGFTDAELSVAACEPPSGYAEASDEPDCDDSDSSVHPGAEEIADDGIDQDCDGADLQSEPGDSGDKGEGRGCASGAPAGAAWLPLALLGLVLAGPRRLRVGPYG